jgi:hypothetical protein
LPGNAARDGDAAIRHPAQRLLRRAAEQAGQVAELDEAALPLAQAPHLLAPALPRVALDGAHGLPPQERVALGRGDEVPGIGQGEGAGHGGGQRRVPLGREGRARGVGDVGGHDLQGLGRRVRGGAEAGGYRLLQRRHQRVVVRLRLGDEGGGGAGIGGARPGQALLRGKCVHAPRPALAARLDQGLADAVGRGVGQQALHPTDEGGHLARIHGESAGHDGGLGGRGSLDLVCHEIRWGRGAAPEPGRRFGQRLWRKMVARRAWNKRKRPGAPPCPRQEATFPDLAFSKRPFATITLG